jgi:hypothetical protein
MSYQEQLGVAGWQHARKRCQNYLEISPLGLMLVELDEDRSGRNGERRLSGSTGWGKPIGRRSMKCDDDCATQVQESSEIIFGVLR